MKKKVLAFLLASTMIIEPFTVASAADFSDGMGQDTVIFDSFKEDPATCHIDIIGPTAKGATLEGSKEFAKGFMMRLHPLSGAHRAGKGRALPD